MGHHSTYVGPTADGTGTLGVFAQRYGANIKDQMTNISIQIYTEDPNQVAMDLGCQELHGYLNQEDIVKKVVEYAKHTLLAHQDWPDKYRAMFDATDGVRVLPIYMHPSSVKVSNGEKKRKNCYGYSRKYLERRPGCTGIRTDTFYWYR